MPHFQKVFYWVEEKKYSILIAVLAYLLVKFGPQIYFSLVEKLNIFILLKTVFGHITYHVLSLLVSWHVITWIVSPARIIPMRVFVTYYFFALSVSMLFGFVLLYLTSYLVLSIESINNGMKTDILSTIPSFLSNILFWIVFIPGIMISKKSNPKL